LTTDTNTLRIDPAFDAVLDPLAPGVMGYTVDHDGALCIPLIWSTEEGKGHVGRYLDSLPRDRIVRVPNVISGKLAGMLARRGFVQEMEFAEEAGEWVEVWERRP
jgi:hypothetical protein